jgi:hypothetical protein
MKNPGTFGSCLLNSTANRLFLYLCELSYDRTTERKVEVFDFSQQIANLNLNGK